MDRRAFIGTLAGGVLAAPLAAQAQQKMPRVAHNGGHSGYGPGFWGPGHDPHTWQVSSQDAACMVNMAKAVGFHLVASPAHGGRVRPVTSGH